MLFWALNYRMCSRKNGRSVRCSLRFLELVSLKDVVVNSFVFVIIFCGALTEFCWSRFSAWIMIDVLLDRKNL